jgi:hypothetical protein
MVLLLSMHRFNAQRIFRYTRARHYSNMKRSCQSCGKPDSFAFPFTFVSIMLTEPLLLELHPVQFLREIVPQRHHCPTFVF